MCYVNYFLCFIRFHVIGKLLFQMRPKSRKSKELDVASSKRLSTNMKPQSKSRSSESLGKPVDSSSSGKISPLANHLLNATRSIRPNRGLGSKDSLGDTSQGRYTRTRSRARATLFTGSSQVSVPSTRD